MASTPVSTVPSSLPDSTPAQDRSARSSAQSKLGLLFAIGPVAVGGLVALSEHQLRPWPLLISLIAAIIVGEVFGQWARRSPSRFPAPDLFAFLLLGPVSAAAVAGLQTGEVTVLSLTAGIPLGCLAVCHVVLRHLERGNAVPAPRALLAAWRGVPGLEASYTVALTTALIFPALLFATGLIAAWAFLSLILVPLAVLAMPFPVRGTESTIAGRRSALNRLTPLFFLLYLAALAR